MENFNFKKYLAEGKLLKENISPDVEEYLTDLYDLFSSEDYEEGEEVSNLISREEYGDPEAYDDAEMFDKAYNEIKKQGGSITIEGQPDIIFTLEGEDIEMKYIAEGGFDEGNIEETILNEAPLDFTFEELGMLRDGLDLMDELEKISSNDYTRLVMKLEKMALQK